MWSRSDWLGIIGIILTLVFGIPVLPYFAQGNFTLGTLSLILAIAFLAFTTAYFYKLFTLPQYTILCNRFALTISDPSGTVATLRKTVVLRPNHPGQEYYSHRNFSCDGNVDFKVDPGVTLADQRTRGGDHTVQVRFPFQLKRFKSVTTWLEAELTNSFTSNTEAFVLLVDQPTKEVIVEIDFPATRLPNTIRATRRYSGKDEDLPTPELNGHQVTWKQVYKCRKFPYGEYEIWWRW